MFGNSEVFQQAVHRLYGGWTALRLAVEHYEGRGNAEEKANWLENDTVAFFASARTDVGVDDVEGCLENFFNDEFNTLVEDGSIEEIARKLLMFYHLVRNGDETAFRNELNRLPAVAQVNGSVGAPPVEDDGMESDGDDEMLEDKMGELSIGASAESAAAHSSASAPGNQASHDSHSPTSRHVRNEPDEDGFITVTNTRNRTKKSGG
ncbi:pre-rRNA-processing protein TSR2 homolog [Paramacrobiotus metropolitanus]|uniref:pre-rRNA-processing protein TSR2 homolog n=1 Tax=Paramacrobiotus metropolitanus TaxID=2943436 RepID=UPI0024457746|nr:pre-rRNA-processing protein TSR2 homolog [Paramacrobiotus metropolitanus]